MNKRDEERLEEKAVLESKIAHLLNDYVQCRNIHIEHIYVNYGACNKGWFPDFVINIDIVTNSILEIPCGARSQEELEEHLLFFRDKASGKK